MPINEKTAVPIPSVSADVGQPLANNFNTSIAETSAKCNASNSLKTVSMTELYDTVYPVAVPVIDNLLYSGTYLFVGAPKVGKSFFMAQVGYHVSNGLPLWGNPVHQGTVLYLALEDDYGRLQKRLSRMFGTDDTDLLHFAIQAKQLNCGLEGQLDEFVRLHPDTRLIIIDTLQKVRELGGEGFSYGSDYEIVTKLKRFSDQHRVCVMVVHHTRKQGADDCFDTISGTNGLLGAADGAFVLQKEKRTEHKAILDVAGRDQQDQRFHLEFDPKLCIWQFIKAETELWKEPPDLVLEAVSSIVTTDSQEWSGTATELLALLTGVDMQANVFTRRLNVGAARLLNEYGIRYEYSRCHAGRLVKLTLITHQA